MQLAEYLPHMQERRSHEIISEAPSDKHRGRGHVRLLGGVAQAAIVTTGARVAVA